MNQNFDCLLDEAIWTAHQLFDRKLVTGSTGNISFLFDDIMYITKSGTCFGRVDKESFARVNVSGEVIEGKPSKEYPMHLALYNRNKQTRAVIHTHSLYSTAFSCKKNVEGCLQELFTATPYLQMLTDGMIGCVPFCKPGSSALFSSFAETIREEIDVYLLCHHGIVVAQDTLYHAFDIVEEFEVSATLHAIVKDSDYQRYEL